MIDKSKIAVNVFDKLANLYQDKFMDVSLYHKTLNQFCCALKKENPEVLELACGPGNITKYLLQNRPDFKILATDLAPNMLSLAKKNNPTSSFQILDSRKINTLNKKFDAIMCGFVLPYLAKNETEDLIESASETLNPKGIIYLSTIEGKYSASGLKKGSTGDEIFMHYYLEKDIVSLLKKNNFAIINIERVDSSNDITKDIILIAQLND